MKRMLALLIVLCLLAGCASPTIPSGNESRPSGSSSTTVPSQSSAPSTAAPSEPSAAPVVQPPVPPETAPISDPCWEEVPLEDGKYRIILPDSISDITGFLFSGNRLYLSATYNGQDGLVEFDPATNSVSACYNVGKGLFKNLGAFGFVYNDYSGGSYLVQGNQPPVLQKIEQNEEYRNYFGGYYFHHLSDQLQKVGCYLHDGTKCFELEFPALTAFSPAAAKGSTIYANLFYDDHTDLIAVHTDTGTWEKIANIGDSAISCFLGDILVGYSLSGNQVYFFRTDGSEVSSFTFPGDYPNILSDDGEKAVFANYDFLLLCDTSWQAYFGERLSEGNLIFNSCQLWNDSLYELYSQYQDGTSTNYFTRVPLSGITPMDPYDALGIVRYPDGITILTGNDVNVRTLYYDAVPLLDEERSAAAKQVISQFLDLFPQGFFQEMLGEQSPHHSLVINVVESLSGISGDTIDSAGGIFYERDGTLFICITANSIEMNHFDGLAHEFMHAIEYHLNTQGEYFDDWESFFPEEVSFTYSYSDFDDDPDFSYVAGIADPDDTWFATSYCKTYPKEDRAVLFSLMFTQNPYYSQFPNIKVRMDGISQVLRKHFSSVRNSEYVIWE